MGLTLIEYVKYKDGWMVKSAYEEMIKKAAKAGKTPLAALAVGGLGTMYYLYDKYSNETEISKENLTANNNNLKTKK